MIRKSLFWGLTLVLVVALVSLIVRGRRMEKEQSARPTEIFQQSTSSPTRVLNPDDLQILSSTMQREGAGKASHEVEIQNNGSFPYSAIQLRFVYLNDSGKVVMTKDHSLNETSIAPGSSITAKDLLIEGVPASASKFQVSVIAADMQQTSPN